jgi:hypothetical protein
MAVAFHGFGGMSFLRKQPTARTTAKNDGIPCYAMTQDAATKNPQSITRRGFMLFGGTACYW